MDQQVGAIRQAVEQLATDVGPQVDHDAALVAVDRAEVGAAPILGRAPPRRSPAPALVAGRRLELDDVRPKIGQQHGGERPGQDARAVQDAQAVEREGSVHDRP